MMRFIIYDNSNDPTHKFEPRFSSSTTLFDSTKLNYRMPVAHQQRGVSPFHSLTMPMYKSTSQSILHIPQHSRRTLNLLIPVGKSHTRIHQVRELQAVRAGKSIIVMLWTHNLCLHSRNKNIGYSYRSTDTTDISYTQQKHTMSRFHRWPLLQHQTAAQEQGTHSTYRPQSGTTQNHSGSSNVEKHCRHFRHGN